NASVQILELAAIRSTFQLFSDEPLNIVTDSPYAANVVFRLESSYLQYVDNQVLFTELRMLWLLINNWRHDFYMLHVCSHTGLPGPIMEGNTCADLAVMPNVVPNKFDQAKLSYDFFHQNARSLQKQFQLTASQAHDILLSCPSCRGIAPAPLAEGVNPRGLTANSVWQTDVTHVPEFKFSSLKYVHVTLDTFSHFLMATAHTKEKSRDVTRHWLTCVATLGLLNTIKTNNGPAYVSEQTRQFLQDWGVSHNTGILHSPTDQAIIEHAHRTLKTMLQKQ
ncbi:POK6 protein, partial [Pardalotus punctatus]|nr:POK6 protein [Pardalotus punctatus]